MNCNEKETKTSKGEVNKVKLDFSPIVIQTTVYIKKNYLP